jgi:outer membrane beta-barrel protein
MRTVATALVGLAVATGVFATTERSASAQEIVLTGPLKGAPPVIRLRQYRAGRFEIAPQLAFTLLDEYEHSYFIGGRANYYFTDWLAVGIWGGAFLNTDTDLTSQIDSIAPRNNFTSTNVAPCVPGNAKAAQGAGCGVQGASSTFSNQTAKLVWTVMPQITAVPFRGKLALFQALFVDTEAYLFLGAGAVGVNERQNCGGGGTQLSCSDGNSFTLSSQIKFAPTFGIGLTFFINDLINVGIEYRALPFSWNRGGFDSRGLGPNQNFPDGKVDGQDETFKFNQVIGLSVGFMLGSRKTSENYVPPSQTTTETKK